MRIDCGKESERPLSRFPLRGKAGAGGFPPRRRHAARQPKPLARIMLAAPPTRGLPPPCASPAGLQRRCTLRHKPDISLANKTGQLDVLPTAEKAAGFEKPATFFHIIRTSVFGAADRRPRLSVYRFSS